MIVIPPAVEFEKYFTNLAKKTWTQYIDREPDTEIGMRKEYKTLTIVCEMTMDDSLLKVKLHYRFLRDTLYCFVEEIEV